jgi:hypothetical protein
MDFALFLYDDLLFEDAAARAEQHRREDPEWPVTALPRRSGTAR